MISKRAFILMLLLALSRFIEWKYSVWIEICFYKAYIKRKKKKKKKKGREQSKTYKERMNNIVYSDVGKHITHT